MLDGKEEGISGKFLERGTMKHMYLLQPEEFWDNYVILDFEKPANSKQLAFCEAYLSSLELSKNERLLDAYRSSYSNKKTPENALNEARELSKRLESYIQFLETKNSGKYPITFADLAGLKQIKSNVENHKLANRLLFKLEDGDEAHNEFHINWEAKKYGLKCKSLLDRFIVNHKTKVITLVDIKTTSSINEFKKSVDMYDYYRQIVFYFHALIDYFKQIDINIDDYDFKAYIVAIGNDNRGTVRVFDMYDESIFKEKSDVIDEVFKQLAFHYTNDLWDYTQEYYDGDGAETLK